MTTPVPATEKQQNFASALIAERVPLHEQQVWRNIADGCNKEDMSKVITALKARPAVAWARRERRGTPVP